MKVETKTRWLCCIYSFIVLNVNTLELQHLQLDVRVHFVPLIKVKATGFSFNTCTEQKQPVHSNFQQHTNISSCVAFSVIMRSQPVDVAVSSQTGLPRYPDTWTTPYKQYGDIFFLCCFFHWGPSSFLPSSSGTVTWIRKRHHSLH